MIADPEHDQAAELLGAYALDAVDPDERRLVEQHLGACPRCAAEVDGLRQVAADLALTSGIDSEQPPAAVWDRIAEGIGPAGTRGEPRRARARGEDGARAEAGVEAGTGTGAGAGSEAGAGAGVETLAARRRRRSVRWRAGHGRAWVAGAVAGAAAAAIAGLAVGLVHTEGQVHQLQSALAGRGSQAAVHAALTSPGHQVVELRSGNGARLAEVVVRPDGAGFVVHSAMSELPATETYQLWASINGRAISLGLLGRRPPSGTAFSLGTSVAGVRELMVTVEPDGGVPTPDRAPLATAPLSIT